MTQPRSIVVNSALTSPIPAAQIDTITGGGTYTSATDITAQIPGKKPWFLDLRAGVPYQFNAAQLAAIAAAGIVLTAA